jgi:hypothetical protein
MAFHLPFVFIVLIHPRSPLPLGIHIALTIGSLAHSAGLTVGGAWFGLALSGRWRGGEDQVDRGGSIHGGGRLGMVVMGWIDQVV